MPKFRQRLAEHYLQEMKVYHIKKQAENMGEDDYFEEIEGNRM